MNTNVSLRNILGAFVGGFLGFLTCYYVRVEYMPLGCLVGVVLGFWYDKLSLEYKQSFRVVGSAFRACLTKVRAWKNSFVNYAKIPAAHVRKFYAALPKDLGLTRKVLGSLAWLVSLPFLFVAWLRKHPMNRADALTCLTYVGVLYGVHVLGSFSALLDKDGWMNQHNKDWTGVFGIGFLLGIIALVVFPVFALAISRSDNMSDFYVQYNRYQRYGPVGWVLFQIKNAALLYAYCFLATEVVFIGGISLALALMVITILTLLFIIAPLRILWTCVTLPGHWFCFGVTVCTTFVSWFSLREMITHPLMAWTIALGNGVVAAGLTEGLRKAYILLTNKIEWLYELNHIDPFETNGEDEILFLPFLYRRIGKPVLGFLQKIVRKVGALMPEIKLSRDNFLLPI